MEENEDLNENLNKDSNQDNIQENNDEQHLPSDFSTGLETEKNNLDAEKFVQRQEQYKQILQTPESINFKTQNPYIWRIGFGRRLGAYIIDNVFLSLLLVVVAAITGVAEQMIDFITGSNFAIFTNPQSIAEWNSMINKSIFPLSLASTFIYYSLEVIFAQSLGKMLLGMQIGDANKKFASYPKLLIRIALKISSSIFTLLFLLTTLPAFETISTLCSFVFIVGCFFVLSSKKQALYDTIARTAVYFKDELQQLNYNEEGKY